MSETLLPPKPEAKAVPAGISTWAALKSAIALALELAKGVRAFLSWLKTEKAQKFISDSGEAFKFLNEANTPEKKQDAARRIGDLLRRL